MAVLRSQNTLSNGRPGVHSRGQLCALPKKSSSDACIRAVQRWPLATSSPALSSNSPSNLVSTRNRLLRCFARACGVAPMVWPIQSSIMFGSVCTSWFDGPTQSSIAAISCSAL